MRRRLVGVAVAILAVLAVLTLTQVLTPPALTHRVQLQPPPNRKCTNGGQRDDCLQQALWGKCESAFMQEGVCDAACGRCEDARRRQLLSATLLVSARQKAACAQPGAEELVNRSMANHASFAEAHGMAHVWTRELIDPNYEGAWNKLAYLRQLLRELLHGMQPPPRPFQWLLWVDWDVVFTDLAMELPLEMYSSRGTRLVVGGDAALAIGRNGSALADYLKLNSGVMLLRVHNWSLALVERMLLRGGKTPSIRRRRAKEIQASVANLCVGCIDDQAVLLELLRNEPSRWAAYTFLERRFALQGHWEDYEDALPDAASLLLPAAEAVATPLRRVGAPPLPPLRKRVFASLRVPLAVHFAGCQLCSGKGPPERTPRCWKAITQALQFAQAIAHDANYE